MKTTPKVNWLIVPEETNYPAAESYLNLLLEPEEVVRIIEKIRKAKMVQFKAKDIFRASGLSLLGVSNHHLEKDIKKISAGKKLSPLLLVRDSKHGKVIVADGYHRLCAIYTFDEDAVIPCKIV